MPWIYPHRKEFFTSLVSGDSGDCLLLAEPQNRLMPPSKIQKSIFTTGDTVYLKQAASHFSPQTSAAQCLEDQPQAQSCPTQEGVRSAPTAAGAASLIQTEVPKPAGIICSATSMISQAPMSSLSYTPSFRWKTPWLRLSRIELSRCNKSWKRSEIKDLTYDLLFYIAFFLPFANYWSC